MIPTGNTASILLVEDDNMFADRLRRNLELAHFQVAVAGNGADGIARLKRDNFDLIVTDVRMPEMGGLELIRKVKQEGVDGVDPDLPVVVLTSVGSVETAVEAMKLGASDYITKEAERTEIVLRIRKVLEQSQIVQENRVLRDQLERRDEFRDLVGDSEAMQRIKEDIEQVGPTTASVLITGETGVGKELVARAIHRASTRAKGPFVDVNCAALPDDNMFQSEVFGHEKGAFTDAAYTRKGRFELAHRGTLFLDEIAEMSKDSQGKILKALEQQTITRLGGTRPVQVDCRYVFATNKDLLSEVNGGRFREDLYYRIDVVRVQIPPLRERRQDIPLLAKFFADQFAKKYNKPPFFFEESAMALLRDYAYPGNIRELRNVIERLVIRARGDVIARTQVEQVGLVQRAGAGAQQASTVTMPEAGLDLEQVEKDLVVQALEKSGWNQKDAATLLNISVDRMNSRVRKFGLRHPSWRVNNRPPAAERHEPAIKFTRVEKMPVQVQNSPELAIKSGRGGSHVKSPFLLVRMHTDAGLTGLGEVSCTPRWSGEDSTSAAHFISAYFSPLLIGRDPANLHGLNVQISTTIAGNHFTKAAIEMALWDLAGKVAGKPVYELLGGRIRQVIPTKWSISGVEPVRAAEIAKWAVQQGFKCMKVKVGIDPDGDVARVRAVREAVGDGIKLGVDANGGWGDADTAVRATERLYEHGIYFVEQPVPQHDVHGLAEVRRRIKLPVVADESVYTPQDARNLVRYAAADVFSVYVGKAGGIAPAREIAEIAAEAGLGCTIGSNLELGVGSAAMLHLAVSCAAVTAEQFPCDIIGPFFYEGEILEQALDLRPGAAVVPDSPGLGIELNDDEVRRFAPGAWSNY
jgi:DNA-binding NtrC family response regulator/L-alanine-DL-glutamate epimerase-like enolase superfamily enzyme